MTRRISAGLLGCLCVLGIAACGSKTSTPKPTLAPAPTAVSGTPSSQFSVPAPIQHPPVAKKTPVSARPRRHIHVLLQPAFRSFLNQLCGDMRNKNGAAVVNDLPYYQYNSGIYYGTFNAGEGQTGDPGLVQQWIQAGNVQCVAYSPAIAGHAVLVTKGWPLDGGWNLIDLDTYNGSWKINDFTFGGRQRVMYAFKSTSEEVLPYGPQRA